MDAGAQPSAADRPLAQGTVLDRYVVEGLLGEGGMAVVYKVRHRDLASLHALKILRVHSASIRERLRAEGRAQAQLRHRNIVNVTDLIEVEGAPGLVMEFIDGPGLDRHLRGQPLPLDEADRLAVGILDGVRAAHAAGLIHRDLKPGNVLLAQTDEGVVPKITDFGLVKAVQTEAGGKSRTRAGTTMGTPAYMAPEQVRDASLVDARADLFSLGVVLYEMVTGHNPFQADDLVEIFNRVTKGDYPHPRSLRPDLPPRMEAAILAALVVDRDARVDTAEALRELWTGDRLPWRGEQAPPDQNGPWTVDEAPKPASTMFFQQSVPPTSDTLAELPAPPPPLQAAETAAPEEPPERKPLWPVFGVVAALLVAGVAWFAWPSGPEEPAGSGGEPTVEVAPEVPAAPAAGPAPDPAPTEAAQPEAPPTPDPAASAPQPQAAPAAAPTPAPTPDAAAQDPQPDAGPEAAPTQPPADAPADPPAAAPPAAPTTGHVSGDPNVRLWLVGATGRFPPGQVPPGTYTVQAFFDPTTPTSAGTVTVQAGDRLAVTCSQAMAMCSARPK